MLAPAVPATHLQRSWWGVIAVGISSFPDGLGELRQLEGLQADGCQLASPFASLYTKDPLLLVKLHDTQLPSLDLSDVGLEEVPQQMLRLTQLTSLSLLKNSIKVGSSRHWRIWNHSQIKVVLLLHDCVQLNWLLQCCG